MSSSVNPTWSRCIDIRDLLVNPLMLTSRQKWIVFYSVFFSQELPNGSTYPVWLLPSLVSHGLFGSASHCLSYRQMDVSQPHPEPGCKEACIKQKSRLVIAFKFGHFHILNWINTITNMPLIHSLSFLTAEPENLDPQQPLPVIWPVSGPHIPACHQTWLPAEDTSAAHPYTAVSLCSKQKDSEGDQSLNSVYDTSEWH